MLGYLRKMSLVCSDIDGFEIQWKHIIPMTTLKSDFPIFGRMTNHRFTARLFRFSKTALMVPIKTCHWSAVILTILKNGQKQLYQWPFLNSDFPISTLWGINVWVPTKNITGLQWYWWFWNSMKTHHPSDHVEVWFFQFSAVWKITNVQCSCFSKVSISENKYVKVLHLLLLELVILWLPCLTPWSALSPMSKFVYTRSKQ